MKTIWKYTLVLTDDRIEIQMPVGARILHVANQQNSPCMWVLVDTLAAFETRAFRIFGTGHQIPDGLTYVGTYQSDPFVWHVFEDREGE